jgi:hypothetical protein
MKKNENPRAESPYLRRKSKDVEGVGEGKGFVRDLVNKFVDDVLELLPHVYFLSIFFTPNNTFSTPRMCI